jgi:hypothetical protein
MTIKEISILLVGLVFLTIGILSCRHYKWKKIKTYIPIALGLFLIYISTVGPLSESKKRIIEITSIDSTKVKSITLQPTQDDKYENLTMFKEERVVIDRNSINEICNTLHEAKVEGEGFLKNPKEACRVEIHFVDNKIISFGVRKSETTTCISLNSSGESGWHYANLDASDFGKLLNNDNK